MKRKIKMKVSVIAIISTLGVVFAKGLLEAGYFFERGNELTIVLRT